MFEPWIGSEFRMGPSPKTLVLGESHYGDHHLKYGYELSRKTILCIEDQILWGNSYRIYTKLASALLGVKPDIQAKKAFWYSVAYHNLITTLLPASRRAPTEEQWGVSLKTLPGLLEDLAPDFVIVMGYRMWRRISNSPHFALCAEFNEVGPCGIGKIGKSFLQGIMHPSSRFSPPQWHKYIQSAKAQIWPNIAQ